jgi:DNA-binding CsgD family transcriptional regulator
VKVNPTIPVALDSLEISNLDKDTKTLYTSYYGERDPFQVALWRMGAGIWPLAARGSDLVSRSTRVERTEFYADFMRPRDVHHLLCVRLVDGSHTSGLVSLYRSMRRPEFTSSDVAQAQLFSPTIVGCLKQIQAQVRLRDRERLLECYRSLNSDRELILLDASGKWLSQSPGVDRWLIEAESRPEYGEFLHRLGLNVRQLYLKAMDLKASEQNRFPEARRFRGPDRDSVQLAIHTADRGNSWLVTVRFGEWHGDPINPPDYLSLTQRQKQVALLLVRGLSSKEIAAELFLSTATVNNHIQAMLAKARVHSRARLIALLTGNPLSQAERTDGNAGLYEHNT